MLKSICLHVVMYALPATALALTTKGITAFGVPQPTNANWHKTPQLPTRSG